MNEATRFCPTCITNTRIPLQKHPAKLAWRCPLCDYELPFRADSERPFLTEYLVGWRDWKISHDGLLLSRTRPVVWPIKEPLRSKCGHLHGPPSLECKECGIYAHKTREQLLMVIPRPSVHGRVALWGVVVEWTWGYQAEYAYPLEIWTIREDLVSSLEAYGAPVTYQAPRPMPKRYAMWEVRPGAKIKVELVRGTGKVGKVYGKSMVEVLLQRPGGGSDVIRVAADKVTELPSVDI